MKLFRLSKAKENMTFRKSHIFPKALMHLTQILHELLPDSNSSAKHTQKILGWLFQCHLYARNILLQNVRVLIWCLEKQKLGKVSEEPGQKNYLLLFNFTVHSHIAVSKLQNIAILFFFPIFTRFCTIQPKNSNYGDKQPPKGSDNIAHL